MEKLHQMKVEIPPKNNLENLRNCWNAISDSKINCPMPNYKLLLRNYK